MRITGALPKDLVLDAEPTWLRDIILAATYPGRFWPGDAGRSTTIGTGPVPLAKRTVIKRSPDSCIYMHRWLNSDPDDLHDHPWDWCSIILAGGYWEVSEHEVVGSYSGGPNRIIGTQEIRIWRAAGSVLFRKATERHRVEIDPSRAQNPVSLFITGPALREWG